MLSLPNHEPSYFTWNRQGLIKGLRFEEKKKKKVKLWAWEKPTPTGSLSFFLGGRWLRVCEGEFYERTYTIMNSSDGHNGRHHNEQNSLKLLWDFWAWLTLSEGLKSRPKDALCQAKLLFHWIGSMVAEQLEFFYYLLICPPIKVMPVEILAWGWRIWGLRKEGNTMIC